MDLSSECVAAVVLLVPAAVNQLWCAERTRRSGGGPRGAARQRMRVANRVMAGVLLVNLLLGTVTTILWADASIGGSPSSASAPLLWPLVLFAAGIAVSMVANAVAGPERRRIGVARPAVEEAAGRAADRAALPAEAAGCQDPVPGTGARSGRIRPVRRAAR